MAQQAPVVAPPVINNLPPASAPSIKPITTPTVKAAPKVAAPIQDLPPGYGTGRCQQIPACRDYKDPNGTIYDKPKVVTK